METLGSFQGHWHNPPTALSKQGRLIGAQPGKEEEHPEGQLDDLKGVTEVGNWKVPISRH